MEGSWGGGARFESYKGSGLQKAAPKVGKRAGRKGSGTKKGEVSEMAS